MNDAADEPSKPTSAEPEFRKVSDEELRAHPGRITRNGWQAKDKTGLDHLRADLSRADLRGRDHPAGANLQNAMARPRPTAGGQPHGWPNCRGPTSSGPNCRGPTSGGRPTAGGQPRARPNCRGPTSRKAQLRGAVLKVRTSSGWRSPRTESPDRSPLLTSPMQISATPT